MKVQAALSRLRYYDGPIDGVILKDSGVNPRKLDQLRKHRSDQITCDCGSWGRLLFLLGDSSGNYYRTRPTD